MLLIVFAFYFSVRFCDDRIDEIWMCGFYNSYLDSTSRYFTSGSV